jgi:1,4-dihydroxy-2-naphthoate octaprenyltransferase
LRLASRGLGEFAIVAGWLLVVSGSDYVQRGEFALLPLVAGFGFAVLVAAVLYINQFPDISADGSSGKRTVVVRLGRSAARWGYPLLILLAYTAIAAGVISGILPSPTLVTLVALPFSCIAAVGLWRFAAEPQRLVPAIKFTILAAHLFGVLLVSSLILTRIFR